MKKATATGSVELGCRKYLIANGNAARNNQGSSAAAIQGNRSRQTERFRFATATAAAVVRPPPVELVGAANDSSANPRENGQ